MSVKSVEKSGEIICKLKTVLPLIGDMRKFSSDLREISCMQSLPSKYLYIEGNGTAENFKCPTDLYKKIILIKLVGILIFTAVPVHFLINKVFNN